MTSRIKSISSTIGLPRTTEVLDDAFDDACDLGQCCMDPCYFFFIKARNLLERYVGQNEKTTTMTDSTVEDNQNQRHAKTLRMFAVQQTTYFLLIGGCWTIIFWRAYPLIDASQGHISSNHKTAGFAMFVACISSWLWAKLTDPGSITRDTLWKFDNYQYDGVLYHAASTLKTMQQPCLSITDDVVTTNTNNCSYEKLARSKYDRYSGHQIARFDHFCGWLGQSIGEENYRCFLVFVTVHTIMATYGTTMVILLMSDAGKMLLMSPADGMTDATIMSGADQTMSVADIFRAALRVDAWVVLTSVLMGISLPFLVTFLSFHTLLVKRGMTTNEHFKWKARRDKHAKARPQPIMGDIEHTMHCSNGDNNNCYDTTALSASLSAISMSELTEQQQFYNLGFAGNLHEIVFPRCRRRREGVKTM